MMNSSKQKSHRHLDHSRRNVGAATSIGVAIETTLQASNEASPASMDLNMHTSTVVAISSEHCINSVHRLAGCLPPKEVRIVCIDGIRLAMIERARRLPYLHVL